MALRLVAIDLDGTLLDHAGQVSPRAVAALRAAAEAGVIVTVATGRPPHLVDGVVDATGGAVSHVVASNGAVVARLPGPELLRIVGFDAELARDTVRRLRLDDPRYGFALATDAGFCHEPGFAERLPAPVGTAPGPDVLALDGREAYKLMVFHPARTVHEVIAELTERADLIDRRLRVSHLGADAAEIGPVDIDKGNGLAWLCDHLGVDAADVVAFGDEHNDLGMLRWAGHAVAMAHADAVVRDAADEVAPADDGVAHVLERLLPLDNPTPPTCPR